MTVFHSDVFTGTAGTALPTYDSAKWVRHAANGVDLILTAAGRARLAIDSGGTGSAVSKSAPASADYEVATDLTPVTLVTNANAYLAIRCNTTGSISGYRLLASPSAGGWQLARVVSGTSTQLGSIAAATFTAGQSYRVTLRVSGSSVKALVDGVEILSTTDSTITTTGSGALFCNPGNAGGVADDKNWQWDNFTVRDLPAAMAATPSVVAAAAADLTTGIALEAAATTAAAAAADLTTGIALAGSAAAVATAGGTLTAGSAALEGAATASAATTADLTTGIALAASATTATTAAAELTTGIALAGAGAAVAAATGTLAAGAVQYGLRGRVGVAARYTGRARRSSTLTGRVAAIG